MITEQELLEFMKEAAYKPMTYQQLFEQLAAEEDADSFKSFLLMLNELEDQGKITRNRNDRYGMPERMNLLRGRIQTHPKGFAFLLPEDKEHGDVYVHAYDLNSAMNGDTVLVRITSRSEHSGRFEGEVVRIVERAVTQIVGTFEHHEAFGFVLPDDKRINRDLFIPQEGFKGAVTGQKVVARIVTYPEGRSAATGEIIEILGHRNDPGVDILSIIRKHQLPEGFPDEVMAEAEAAPETITEEEIESQGRRDLRDKVIVTIDGEDAKDLDDAVNVELLPNGNYLLGVHIADVGYYVREKSALDQEAYRRGCSVYLVDRVIPMLPHRLSNGICSLNPQVDRLTMSCEMEFDGQTLKRVRHDVFTSVIRTKERMTYNNVRKILLNEDPEVTERYAELVGMFQLMEELAMKLRRKRMKRGAIDFDFVEAKVLVDADGKPTDIVKRERSVAEQIIEEFMLAANETVAEHFYWLKVPFLYRVHEDPDMEKLFHFVQFAANFGYTIKGKGGSAIHPRALQTLLEEINGTKEQTVISTVLLRSMKQARYDAESLGHFGLAAEFYSHFTSPIRRYPDLVIHRVMREVFENGGSLPENRIEALAAKMPDIAQQSSERERIAVEAERDTDKLKKAEYMLERIGEEFEGIISGVTSFGIFIELENTVEGLIRLADLHDDYYHFHEQHMVLVGERTSRMFRIGDTVLVRVESVDMNEHTIEFVLLKHEESGERGMTLLPGKRKGRGQEHGRRQGGQDRGGAGRRGGRLEQGQAHAGKQGGRGKRGKAAEGPDLEPIAAQGARSEGKGSQAGEQAGAAGEGKAGKGGRAAGSRKKASAEGGVIPAHRREGKQSREAWQPEDDFNLERLLGQNQDHNKLSGDGQEQGLDGRAGGRADGIAEDAGKRSKPFYEQYKRGGKGADGAAVRTDMWGLPIRGTGGIIDDGEYEHFVPEGGRSRRGRSRDEQGRNGSQTRGRKAKGQNGAPSASGGNKSSRGPAKTGTGPKKQETGANLLELVKKNTRKKKKSNNGTASFVRKKQK